MSVFVIAEAGVNHNGSTDTALQLVDAAAAAGADAVKFQSYRTEAIVARHAPKAGYQQQTTGADESQFDMLKKLELGEPAHFALQRRCRERGIEFLSTPFDAESLALLLRMEVARLKIPSGEIVNGALLLQAARSGKPLIVSTGMSSLEEVEAALGVIAFGYVRPDAAPGVAAFREVFASKEGKAKLNERVTLLHCTTEYPAPIADVNLRAMDTLAATFGLRVGYSDHTLGIGVAVAAAARGATVVEKHLTLDRSMPGPDHRASLEPAEFAAMVRAIRDAAGALGDGVKAAAASELANRGVARKSLVALRAIRKGEAFSEANLGAKRPGTGISPMRYWELIGTPAARDYDADDLI